MARPHQASRGVGPETSTRNDRTKGGLRGACPQTAPDAHLPIAAHPYARCQAIAREGPARAGTPRPPRHVPRARPLPKALPAALGSRCRAASAEREGARQQRRGKLPETCLHCMSFRVGEQTDRTQYKPNRRLCSKEGGRRTASTWERASAPAPAKGLYLRAACVPIRTDSPARRHVTQRS